MNDIARLRAEAAKAETDLRVARRFAEMDRDAEAHNPEMRRDHAKNDARVRKCEERLSEARARLDAALAIR
jgi:hypothetical protein